MNIPMVGVRVRVHVGIMARRVVPAGTDPIVFAEPRSLDVLNPDAVHLARALLSSRSFHALETETPSKWGQKCSA